MAKLPDNEGGNSHSLEKIKSICIDSDKQSRPPTWREARKLYKIALSNFLEKQEKEREKRKQRLKESNTSQSNECLRCFLITQGTIMVSNVPVCLCKVEMPNDNTIITEDEVLNTNSIPAEITNGEAATAELKLTDYELDSNIATLAITTTLGSVSNTKLTLENVPPLDRLRNRIIEDKIKHTLHNCKQTFFFKQTSTNLPLLTQKHEKPKYVVIYAPPGYGKTTLQQKLASRGVYLLDTDDIPSIREADLRELTQWTSILTNRLDVLPKDVPTVAFMPTSPESLHNRLTDSNMKISKSDAEFWYESHDFSEFNCVTVCQIDSTFVSNWFDINELQVQSEELAARVKTVQENLWLSFENQINKSKRQK